MKKIFIVLALLCVSFAANAQFFIGAGYNNMKFKGQGQELRAVTSYQSFDVEAGYDLALNETFTITGSVSGDFCTMRNAKSVTLNIPVRAKVYFGHGDVRGFVFAGPAFTYGLTSKTLILGQWSDDYLDEKRTNLYLGGGLGFEYDEHFVIKIGYDFGLLDTAIFKSSNYKYNIFNVTLAYKF